MDNLKKHNKLIDKKELLFILKDYFEFISYNDIQKILNETYEYFYLNERSTFVDPYFRVSINNGIELTLYEKHERHEVLEWRQNGLLHKSNGPAVYHPNGQSEYWENGEFIKWGDWE